MDMAAEVARIARSEGKVAAWAYVKGWNDCRRADYERRATTGGQPCLPWPAPEAPA